MLKAIVKTYIETGEPVGSKMLTELLADAPSSATLRNEMSELCALGLLSQPHTSAGRVPTSLGYSTYVSHLMKPVILGDSTKNFINDMLSTVGCDPQSIPDFAAKALCELTGLPAISCYLVDEGEYLKNAELLPVSRRSAILLLVTSDGRTASRLCRISSDITKELHDRFSDIVNERLKRKNLRDFNKATLQNMMTVSGLDSLTVMPLFTELFDMAGRACRSKVSISGAANLYNIFSEDSANRIIALAENEEPLLSIIGKESEKTEVLFGNETLLNELNDKVFVLSKYKAGDKYCGKIGIIGPGRMSYEQIIPSIEYIASRLSQLMTRAIKDMED